MATQAREYQERLNEAKTHSQTELLLTRHCLSCSLSSCSAQNKAERVKLSVLMFYLPLFLFLCLPFSILVLSLSSFSTDIPQTVEEWKDAVSMRKPATGENPRHGLQDFESWAITEIWISHTWWLLWEWSVGLALWQPGQSSITRTILEGIIT